jgi:hypothetical protein
MQNPDIANFDLAPYLTQIGWVNISQGVTTAQWKRGYGKAKYDKRKGK